MKQSKMKRLSVRVSEQGLANLKACAEQCDVTLAEFVRHSLAGYRPSAPVTKEYVDQFRKMYEEHLPEALERAARRDIGEMRWIVDGHLALQSLEARCARATR